MMSINALISLWCLTTIITICTLEDSPKEALDMALATWPVDVRPVVHYSESRSDEYGDPKIKPQAHSDSYVRPVNTYGLPMDIMLEAKHKELALFKMRELMENKMFDKLFKKIYKSKKVFLRKKQKN